MNRFFVSVLLICSSLPLLAQDVLPMADVFKAMPDSLLPYLSKNNRLDMIDFMEAHMKAEVTNLMEGSSEMTALSADSLSLRMSDVLTVGMSLSKVEEPIDSSRYVVLVRRTYSLNENQAETIVDTYSSAWRHLQQVTERSSLLKRDEKLLTPVQR